MEKLLFYHLAPTSEADIDCYKEALDYVFEHPEIKNIAITGTYGSGKSSIFESYVRNNNGDLNLLYLSLAHFSGTDEKKSGSTGAIIEDNKKSNMQQSIEGKLINQLIQQIPSAKTPLSLFQIKQSSGKRKSVLYSIAICLIIALVALFIGFDTWKTIVLNSQSSWIRFFLWPSTTPVIRVIIPIIIIICIGLVIYNVLHTFSGKNYLRKISIHGNEIELFKNDDSLFDQYLNEILYLLENSDAQGVVFEDIDRFNNTDIFERIREINALVNMRLVSKDPDCCPLRFFYMIRDDLFTSKDRTKFFDYIIPVIPVVNGSNSYNKLKDYLNEMDLYNQFEDRFLRNICLYIDDLRLLKNIYNEFLIYKNKLGIIDLDVHKLFALITYKNIFPQDFAELPFNKGYIHALFANKNRLITEQTEKVSEELKSVENRIQSCENEHMESIAELDCVKNNMNTYHINDRQQWVQSITARKQAVEDLISGKVDQLKQTKAELEKKINAIEHFRMSSLLNNEYAEETYRSIKPDKSEGKQSFDEIVNNFYFPLLKYLVSNGYIDESYYDYTSIFYPNSLSINDKNFLLAVNDRRACPPDYQLDSPALVLEHLTDYDLTRKETINYCLFKYIMNGKQENRINLCINQIRQYNHYDFIEQYLTDGSEIDNTVRIINQKWPSFFSFVLHNDRMSAKAIKTFSLITLTTSSNDILLSVNDGEALNSYISSDPDYMSIDTSDTETIKRSFDLLGVSFESIKTDSINADLFDYVYESSMYKINPQNIRLMLKRKCEVLNPDSIMPCFLEYVIEGTDKPLCEYLWDNSSELFTAYCEMYNGRIDDCDQTIISVLNDSNLSDIMKEQYIKRLSNLVVSLNQIEHQYDQKLLVKNHKADYTAENVLEYYTQFGLDEVLIQFINSDEHILDYNAESSDQSALFIADCVKCNDIDDIKYEQIIRNVSSPYENFNLKELYTPHVVLLISNDLIVMNRSNLLFLRANYPDCIIRFICSNANAYLDVVKNGDFVESEALELLGRDSLSDEIKISLVNLIRSPISISNLSLNDNVLIYILKNRFQIKDLPFLMKKYTGHSFKIQNQINNLIINNTDEVIENAESIDNNLLTVILKCEDFALEDKAKILAACAKKQSKSELINSLRILNANKIADNLNNVHTKVEINEDNSIILKELFDTGIITEPEKSMDRKFYKMIRLSPS